jgi:uncharacterized membrane protein YfbV (UPF0208 family)
MNNKKIISKFYPIQASLAQIFSSREIRSSTTHYPQKAIKTLWVVVVLLLLLLGGLVINAATPVF